MEYLYDGSFDGLLTCIYKHYYQAPAEGIYPQEFYQPSLMNDYTVVPSDPALAARVYAAIENKISGASLSRIYDTFLSSALNKENLILNYLRLGFRIGPKVDLYLSHPDVYPLHKVSRQVTHEVHRFLGLLRFADSGRFLYASISPDHHILPLIADHFADRMAGERFIIHDQKRKLAVVYDGSNPVASGEREWYLTDFPHDVKPSLTKEEHYLQTLWQHYFQEISIASRRNPRLQSQFVPQRYRRHLVEFQLPPNDSL